MGNSVKPRLLVLKKDIVPTILTSLWQVASRHLKKKANDAKQANNARRTAGQLLGHFPNKIRLVFRSKTFPKNDALTQKSSNVQDNSNVAKKSLSSILSIKVHGHFRTIFVKLSAVFLLLTFLLLFAAQKEKISHQFLLKCL